MSDARTERNGGATQAGATSGLAALAGSLADILRRQMELGARDVPMHRLESVAAAEPAVPDASAETRSADPAVAAVADGPAPWSSGAAHAPPGTGPSARGARPERDTGRDRNVTGTDGAAHREQLEAIREDMGDCRRCGLCEGRNSIVFGVGSAQARLMFIGEGPGAEEDARGEPFVGAAGKLLDRMIGAMGMARSDVYIANVVKCRPPDNRAPDASEMKECLPFLRRQILSVRPAVIVTLGRTAMQGLLETDSGIGALRGRWQRWEGIAVMPTYHPAYLLRKPEAKREAWQDLQAVMARLGEGRAAG